LENCKMRIRKMERRGDISLAMVVVSGLGEEFL
jgi:hypothetical protein